MLKQDSILVVSCGYLNYFIVSFSSGEAVQVRVLWKELQAEELIRGAQGAVPDLPAERWRV